MSEISELERRITAALDRAGQAMDRLSLAPEQSEDSDAADVKTLSEELEAERMANAQLEERVRAIKDKQETTMAALEAEVSRLRATAKSKDGELQRIKSVNEELRRSNVSLRDAMSQGLSDPHLVNTSMMSELEGLRAARSADRAEIDDVLEALRPVLKEASDA